MKLVFVLNPLTCIAILISQTYQLFKAYSLQQELLEVIKDYPSVYEFWRLQGPEKSKILDYFIRSWIFDDVENLIYWMINGFNIYCWMRIKRAVVQVSYSNVDEIVKNILRSVRIQEIYLIAYTFFIIINIAEIYPYMIIEWSEFGPLDARIYILIIISLSKNLLEIFLICYLI